MDLIEEHDVRAQATHMLAQAARRAARAEGDANRDGGKRNGARQRLRPRAQVFPLPVTPKGVLDRRRLLLAVGVISDPNAFMRREWLREALPRAPHARLRRWLHA